MLWAGIAFVGICLCESLHLSVCLSAQNLKNYWPEIDVTW